MEDILDVVEPDVQLSDFELFKKIWFQPRQVFAYLKQKQYDKFTLPLIIIAGMAGVFEDQISSVISGEQEILTFAFFVIIGGALLGIIVIYLFAFTLSKVGRWLKGTKNIKSYLRVYTFANLPLLVSTFFISIPMAFAQIDPDNFEQIFTPNSFDSTTIWLGTTLLVLANLWTFILHIIGISEIQGFSLGRAFWNFFIPLIIIFVVAIIIAVALDLNGYQL